MSNRIAVLAAVLAAEMAAAVLLFQVLSDFECRRTGMELACRGLRSAMIRGFCVFVALGLFLWIRPDLRARVAALAAGRGARPGWAMLHMAGVALIFGPWLAVGPAETDAAFAVLFPALSAGALLAVGGALLWLMPARDWGAVLRAGRGALPAVVALAALIPDLADAFGLAWAVGVLVEITFHSVAFLLRLAGNEVILGYAPPTIGVNRFVVEIADSCSGVEGFALVTGFMVIYAVLMRGMIRPGRYWLVVWPAALAASWAFNILRITALILIGAWISPDLAVNGFHSFAGWFFFAIIALAILLVVQASSWLQHEPPAPAGGDAAPLPPLTEDRAAARIVPFLVFMLSGMAVNAFLLYPELGYPFQMIVLGATVWLFRRGLFAPEPPSPETPSPESGPRVDPVAVAAGAAVGAGWVLAATPEAGALAGLETLGPAALALWAAFRVLGTTFVIPVVEEAFFRGYVLMRLDRGGLPARVAAVAVSSLAFALLHGRIVEAGLAGLIFAWVTLRRGRLRDAIVSHMVANGIVAAAALATGDWSLI